MSANAPDGRIVLGVVGGRELLTTTPAVDPSAGAGVFATIGSWYFGDNGQVWWKSGALDTDWTIFASGGSAILNDMWAPVVGTPHPANDEFLGPALDASWSQVGFSAALDFASRPNPYVNPVSNRASFENRRSRDVTAETSWLRIQPAVGVAGGWKRLDTAAFGGSVPANLLVWSRITHAWRNEQGVGAGDDVGISFFFEDGAGFTLASHATMLLSSTSIGAANRLKPVFYVRNDTTGTTAVITQGTPQNQVGTDMIDNAFFSGYIGIQKIDQAYYAWIMDDGGHLFMGEALPVGGGGDGPDNVNAVAFWCSVAGGGVPGTMFYDFDFMRFEQGAADWLP